MTRLSACAVVMAVAVLAAPAAASTTMVVIQDGNSQATFLPYTGEGLDSWLVDGREIMNRQWFWFRVGDVPECPLCGPNLEFSATSDADYDQVHETLYLRYLYPSLKVELWFMLAGGPWGSGAADMAEIVRLTNMSTTETLDLHFFQYSDFDLGRPETVVILGGDPDVPMAGNTARQTAYDIRVAETVVTPRPSAHQAGLDGDILALLTDALPSNLNNDPGPKTGDASWAFQWDVLLQPGRTLLISKDKNVVPEPATLALLAGGAALALVVRRRR